MATTPKKRLTNPESKDEDPRTGPVRGMTELRSVRSSFPKWRARFLSSRSFVTGIDGMLLLVTFRKTFFNHGSINMTQLHDILTTKMSYKVSLT